MLERRATYEGSIKRTGIQRPGDIVVLKDEEATRDAIIAALTKLIGETQVNNIRTLHDERRTQFY